MKELTKTNRLTIVVIVIVLVIITGLITFTKPDVKYTLTPSESLVLLNDSGKFVTPVQVVSLLRDSSGKSIFVDVRNSVAFERGHPKSAVNIPVRELFTAKSKSFFKELKRAGQSVILYGETQQQADGPWLMLQMTGFNNAKLFTGSFSQLDPAQTDSLARLLPQFSETPLIDTVALREISSPKSTGNNITEPANAAKKTVVPVKKEASSGGGC